MGWYIDGNPTPPAIAVNSSLIVSSDKSIEAVWKESVQTALITTMPDPLIIETNSKGQIDISPLVFV